MFPPAGGDGTDDPRLESQVLFPADALRRK